MLVLGIDVVIMIMFAVLAVIVATIMACVLMMDQDTGVAVVNTAAFTGLAMVIGYVLMTKVLDIVSTL